MKGRKTWRRAWLSTCLGLMAVLAVPAYGQDVAASSASPTLTLAGVVLHGASPAQIDAALRTRGMHRYDGPDSGKASIGTMYNYRHSTSSTYGAYRVHVVYTLGHDRRFAAAVLIFYGHIERPWLNKVAKDAKILKVKRMVEAKYGKPEISRGSVKRGSMDFRWFLPDGMFIELTRGGTRVGCMMTFVDLAANRQLTTQLVNQWGREHPTRKPVPAHPSTTERGSTLSGQTGEQ